MQYSVVNYKTVKENIDFRYEAEFWLPNYIEEENLLNQTKTISLSECTTFSNGRAFDSNEFCFDGEVYISKIGDVTQKRDFHSWEKVSKKHFKELKAKYLKNNDILMTLTGDPPDVGRVQLIYNPPKEQLSWNQRVALLRLKEQDSITSPEFLFVVLSSKYCRDHIERWAKGIRQRNVGNPAVLSMAIPVLPKLQNTLSELVKKSFDLIDQSKLLYSQVEQLLLSELGLLDWKTEHELAFVKSFSDTQEAERFDAEYFQPKYDEIVETVKKYKGGFDELGNVARTKRGSLVSDKFYNQESGTPYIRGADFSSGFLDKNKMVFIDKSFVARKETRVKARDIVFALIGTVGSSALIDEELDNAFISNNLGKITAKHYNSIVLQVLLHSIIGKMYFEKKRTQTAQPKISDKDIHEFILPKLESKIEKEIEQKYFESQKSKKLSKSLLEIAKRGVEIAIEKDEKEAKKWIDNEIKSLGIKL